MAWPWLLNIAPLWPSRSGDISSGVMRRASVSAVGVSQPISVSAMRDLTEPLPKKLSRMPNSTLSRRIGALEKAIGLRLLHRTTRKVELTEAGLIYFERCKRIADEARLAHEQLGELLAQPSGVLRASLPVDFAVTYLAPLIAGIHLAAR